MLCEAANKNIIISKENSTIKAVYFIEHLLFRQYT